VHFRGRWENDKNVSMEKEKTIRKKFITIRVNREEEDKINTFVKQTTARSVSEYARDVLLKMPVTFYTRNKTRDEILTVLIALQKDLNGIANNFNQAIKKLHLSRHDEEILLWVKLYETLAEKTMSKVEVIRKEMIKLSGNGNKDKDA
jgi:hypothetical protein